MEVIETSKCRPVLTSLFYGWLVVLIHLVCGEEVLGYTETISRYFLVECKCLSGDGIHLLFQTDTEFDLLLVV